MPIIDDLFRDVPGDLPCRAVGETLPIPRHLWLAAGRIRGRRRAGRGSGIGDAVIAGFRDSTAASIRPCEVAIDCARTRCARVSGGTAAAHLLLIGLSDDRCRVFPALRGQDDEIPAPNVAQYIDREPPPISGHSRFRHRIVRHDAFTMSFAGNGTPFSVSRS
ncbi:hypothetical protein [Burkholderia ubonensis]|uniref:hypothetical protein n=1 Tax=Burkholderia ubonensis TaxID=101571 RepID=UPI001054AD93|nr:hypothetical protein [Burkholderia ubonensis]